MRALNREPPYALVVLGEHMGGMGGALCAHELRTMGFGGVIVGMSAEPAGSKARLAFERAGIDECVEKDWVGVLRLNDILRALVSGRDPRRPRVPRAPAAPRACERPDMFEVAAAKRAFSEAAKKI